MNTKLISIGETSLGVVVTSLDARRTGGEGGGQLGLAKVNLG